MKNKKTGLGNDLGGALRTERQLQAWSLVNIEQNSEREG